MAYEFKLPDLGEGLTEGEIARWLVEEGQEVAEDDPLVEIQTDKTTVEIPSPAAGKVSRSRVQSSRVPGSDPGTRPEPTRPRHTARPTACP
jgi:pyruvate dehydrogenase E2 component (dihydrolipoamide acetyltransferase)